MGAWGIKALESDEGLDVLDILENEYVPEHPVMDLGEIIELMKKEVMLGEDFSQIDFLFDNTAMALAELYFQWKDEGKLDYHTENHVWDKVTGFTAPKESIAFLLRQLTDMKNEVPDEDGIRESVELWKNEDSGEVNPEWLEHLDQLLGRLAEESEGQTMYIKKYWGSYIGGTDDSLNLIAFLEDQKKEEISLGEIFAKIGLDKQNWDFHQTVENLEFTHSDGVDMDFHFAIDLVTNLAAIMLECSISGSVDLHDLDEYDAPSRRIRITATPDEHDAMNKALADFVRDPLAYDLHELVPDEDMLAMAEDCESIRRELYESGRRSCKFHVKAEDVKELLTGWEGADGCFATNRIMVEGHRVGYCYREQPDGDWDSGWRFTAGDESDAYMDDPHNSGIYKLNTVCNDDPDIIPLLAAPYGSAFERDENGVFQSVDGPEPETEEENKMDLLEQCQVWNENDEYQKIIDALEAIPERTPEEDSELARAYNNLAEPGDRELLKKAIALLKPHEEYFQGDHYWNFRMGYSYYYLDQEGRALPYFRKALEARPGDEDTKELIDWCQRGIALPQFSECFRERTEAWWETFAEQEAEFRRMMDEDKDHTRGQELVDQMEETLNLVFDEISFEMGFNGEKHELILTPEGDKVKLFELVYFRRHAPQQVLEHWNILVGRQPSQNIGLRTDDGWDISGDDVQVWLEDRGENSFALSVYCEKLLPLFREEEGRAWWMLTTLTDQVLGEIPHMRYIDFYDVLEAPKEEPSILMSQLPDKLKERGLDFSTDPVGYLENSYTGYKMKPNEDPDADWRLDVMAGSTNCSALISEYLNNENDFMDDLHADGAVAGFLCYPLDSFNEFEGEERSRKIFDFRDKLEEVLTAGDGPEVLTLTGGATGIYCGYVDFIAWDIRELLKRAKEFFEGSDIPWASFHTFRREAGTVPLKNAQDGEPDMKDQKDELEETLSGMDYIPYTPENAEAFFQQLEQWNDEDEYTRCIQALNAIPEELRDYRIAYALARALENYAIIGDHDEGTLKSKGDKALLRAIDVLESVREEGQDKAQWNMRMAYAYQYLHEQEEKAIPYAQRWAELDRSDENAPVVIRECKAEIRKRRRRREKTAKFVPGETPFEGFDFTNFWDDNWYAQKEYISDPPSDELIASVEEDLGYKLPASYIWLMKQHNGGIPVNTCYPSDEPTSWAEDHVAITGIFGIGREKSCSLCGELGSQFMIDEWEYPAIGVAICDCPSAGHDMIFLDYRACGPQGEPAVVHVDQENDYKITHLADSFEEFIRGLEHESVYDLDDADENGGADEEETAQDSKGAFAGFVLLSKGKWDKAQFIRDMKEKWDITVEEDDEDKSDDALVFDVGDMIAAVSLMPAPIPDGEAETNAENNYMWPEAVEVAKAHKAHIMVAVLGKEEDVLEEGKLYTKLVAACCRQKYATGVYTSGVVFEPRFYEGFADMMRKDELPIFNWIWFGLYRSEGGMNAYTYGMDVFGKDEMEVLNADAEPGDLRDFLASLVSYVLEGDVELHDGETIGFAADDIHAITRSPGVSLPEEQMTLKISYEPTGDEPDEGDDDSISMDDASYHIESIEEKELGIDPINAYNHMAIYLRWCIEHDLMDEKFLTEHGEVVKQVKADPSSTDLRLFIRAELHSCLLSSLFNRKGRAFAQYYYGENDAPYYPSDIDDYALEYFGPERYHSNEFQQEAYLFISFDEGYYQAMAKVIDERFTNWQGQGFDEDTLEPSEVAQAVMEYLDCECTYFPAMKDDDPIMSAYSYARRLGVREGFIPVLIKADETLLECLVMNADPENEADCYEFDLKTVAEYRKKMLAAPMKDGKAILDELTGQRKEEAEDDDMDWEEEVLGEMEGGEPNDRFSNYWNDDTQMTYPLILAKIPVKNAWEIFAYLPFGNWNECPDIPELMAVAKYWFEQYGAIPAAMSHDELEFALPSPIAGESAMEVAVQQYGFCPDMDQNFEELGALADTLRQSTVWYFWWD